MKMAWTLTASLAVLISTGATRADTSISIGISGWIGFAPLTLAKETGIFKKNGLDVTLTKIPQASRHLALASGDIQCAATSVETWIIWNAAGVASRQIFQMDKSYGADGIAVRNDVKSFADLEGKAVAVSAPGTSPFFFLLWMLAKNGMTAKDVKVVNMEPGPAAQAFVAGKNDAAMTYAPYLSTVRAASDKGKILATTLDYPAVMDTLGCTPAFLDRNADAAKALANSYFQALDMIADEPEESREIMARDVKQSSEDFAKSAKFLRWQNRAANQKFFKGEFRMFSAQAADLLLNSGIIKSKPNIDDIVDTRFIR